MTTCKKNENGSRSDGGPQLSGLGLSPISQGFSHIFSWIITRLKQIKKFLELFAKKKGIAKPNMNS